MMAFLSSRERLLNWGWAAVKTWGPWLLVLWPVWALFGLLRENATNIPFLDDFMTVELLEKAQRGQLSLHDFFAAQMEHRIAFTRVVMLVFHKLWPKRFFIMQVWFNWALLCLTLVNVAVLLRQTAGSLRQSWPVLALASLTLFSPVQFNILLWAFMHQVVILGFFLTSALVVWQTRWPVALRFGVALVCALGATLSFGSGILLWLVLVPVIWWCAPALTGRTKVVVVSAWLLAFAVTMVLYFHNLKNEVPSAYAMGQGEEVTLGRDLAVFAADPLRDLWFTARLLGNTLMRGNTSTLMESSKRVGLVLMLLYALCLGWWVWRFRDHDLRRRLLPWLAVGGYGIGTAVAITLGRSWTSGAGIYAINTRYVVHAVPLVMALPVLLWMIGRDLRARFPKPGQVVTGVLLLGCGGLVALEATAWTYGERMMEVWASARKRDAAGNLFGKTRIGDGFELARRADELRLLNPPMLKNLRLDAFKILPHALNDQSAVFASLKVEPSDDGLICSARGRALLKKSWRVADGIFFATEAADGHWEIVHVGQVRGLPLFLNDMLAHDLSFHYQEPGGIPRAVSNFTARFPMSELPQGRSKVTAWAYDHQTRSVALMPGVFEVDTANGIVKSLGTGEEIAESISRGKKRGKKRAKR